MTTTRFTMSAAAISRPRWISGLALVAVLFVTSPGIAAELELVKGLPAPEPAKVRGDRKAFLYPDFVVVTTPHQGSVGEDIAIYPRGNSRSLKEKDLILRIEGDEPTHFVGLWGDAVFLIKQTGPDGIFSIYSLSQKKEVFTSGYDEPVEFTDGKFIELYQLLESMITMTPQQRKEYPDVAAGADNWFTVGRFQKVRIDLEDYSVSPVGKPVLRNMQ